MIPKTIHYVWLGGGKKNALSYKCINSWKKFLPDYDIIEWNEDNFDIDSCIFVKEACETRKFAFASDYIRLYVLYNYGGIYMDTDVEITRDITAFLKLKSFSGFESYTDIPTGIMASEKKLPIFKEFLDYYNERHFISEDGRFDDTSNVQIITNICKKHGLIQNNTKQTICDFTLFPKDFFCPKDAKTLKVEITKNTYAIHHFNGSWNTGFQRKRHIVYAYIRRCLGPELTKKLEDMKKNLDEGGIWLSKRKWE